METNLCVAGFGGQGVMTLGKFLASATCDSTDKNVTFFPSYGAEQRGGTANCFVVISDEMVGAPLGDVMDDLIVMNGPSLQKFLPTLKQGGTLFINSSIVPEEDIDRTDIKVVKAPVTEMALEMGNAKVLNVIMLGVYVGYTEVVSPEVVWGTIEHKLAKKAKLLPLNKEAFEKMKDGVVLLNFARDLLVDEEALIEAVESGKVKKYVTDFANETVAGREGILVTPHLGASTEESEENCAEMAVKEIRDYLENGNIKNSVNYPNCDMGTCVAVGRISLAHSNTPNMISQVTKILGSEGLNIADMTNKSKGEFAYTLIDLESAASAKALDELKEIEGMYRVRVVK